MPFTEALLWIAAAILALIAMFWLVASLFNMLHPRITVPIGRILLDAVVIAVSGGIAYWIWESFLR